VEFWQHSVLPAFAERDRIGPEGMYIGWIPSDSTNSQGRKRTADAAGIFSETPSPLKAIITPFETLPLVMVRPDGC
jgi:hypothetical protein